MKILFLTVAIRDLSGNGLYVDLLKELRNMGNEVFVVCPNERRNRESTKLIFEESITFLRVKTGNITKTNSIEKGISTLMIDSLFILAINKYFKGIKFDLVIYTTPPVTFERVISFIKERDKCLSYLILKDIFPQNAVDLNLIKINGIIYKYFRAKEKRLLKISDFIGCTSNGNIEYIKKHNPEVDINKIELFPNSIYPRDLNSRVKDKKKIRKKYNVPEDSILFVYGGNLGRPQGIEFLKEVLDRADEINNFFIIIFGSGTGYLDLKDYISESGLKNVKIHHSLSNDEYWNFLSCCDVGLIFLDYRFTVPNTPARLTYYMESGLPILAATDKNTDINEILNESNCGLWIESNDIKGFYNHVDTLIRDSNYRKTLGLNGRNYLECNYTINRNYNIIMNHLK